MDLMEKYLICPDKLRRVIEFCENKADCDPDLIMSTIRTILWRFNVMGVEPVSLGGAPRGVDVMRIVEGSTHIYLFDNAHRNKTDHCHHFHEMYYMTIFMASEANGNIESHVQVIVPLETAISLCLLTRTLFVSKVAKIK